jgi:hypothetical protein
MMEESNLSQQDLECANVALAQDMKVDTFP